MRAVIWQEFIHTEQLKNKQKGSRICKKFSNPSALISIRLMGRCKISGVNSLEDKNCFEKLFEFGEQDDKAFTPFQNEGLNFSSMTRPPPE